MMNLYSRISRISFLVRCMIRALFYGAANKIPDNVSTVIVVPSGKLGDVVCTTPVLHAIRTNLPNTRIIIAGDTKLHRPLLSDSGLADDYINLEEKGAMARIKEHHADAAFIIGPSFIPVALLYLSGIPLVVAPRVEGGVSPSETRPYKILQRFIKTFPFRIGEYAPAERLKVLEPLGIYSNDTKKHLGFSDMALKKINQFFIRNGIDLKKDFVVGISPSVGNEIKEWPTERFAEVAVHLIEKYQAKVVLTGEYNDNQKVKEIIKNVKNSKTIISTENQLNIDELKAFISKLKLFISVDTGPVYIAEAFNVPTIDIVGPMDEREQPPIGDKHMVVVPKRDKPALHILTARLYNRKEARRQAESITSEMVIAVIDTLVPILSKNSK